MAKLHIISWNVNGLNGPIKRAACLDYLHRQSVDVAFIQESHLRTQDTKRFANKHYYVASSASLNSKTRGSLIVLKRSLSLNIMGKYGSEDGRIAYIKTVISGRKFAFISVYAPSQYESDFFPNLVSVLAQLQDFSLIVGADMNACINLALDKSVQKSTFSQLSASKDINNVLTSLSLVDIYRIINPTSKQFTFYSARHQTLSRIDYILASQTSFSEIHNVAIIPSSLSDHSMVSAHVTLRHTPPRASRWRFNTSLLQNEEFCTFLSNSLNTFIEINTGSVEDPRFLWDAIKGSIRDSTISFSSYLKKSRLRKISELEDALIQLESERQRTQSDTLLGKISTTKTELNSLLRQRAEFLIHRTRRNYYFNGSRPSHLLAVRLKQHEKFTSIMTIKTPSATLTEPCEINAAFKKFYSNLYSSEVFLNTDSCENFFKDLELPTITSQDSEKLAAPITLEELKEALSSMKKGKSPGWDGIPPEVYLVFWDLIGPPLLNMINTAIDKGAFNSSINSAIITLLLKPNKDPSECGNYRPLSLLNGDVKLYAKVLASRLEGFLTKLIHNDQTGFIKGRLASDNVRRLLHIIHAANENDLPCSVLSLDAEKAFDRLEKDYLWVTLDKFGLGSNFIKLIKVLYANPSAMVYTNNTFSSQFPISRGTRQGCPLSPLLFALSLEPLAQKIRQHPSVVPISINNSEHRISLFADDILLYVGDTGTSLPHILSMFDTFSSLSGYKINWNKSSLMHLNSIRSVTPLPSNIPVVGQFKYLGIDISPSIFHIASHNFQNILNQIVKDIERWSKLPNSLQARVSIVKMDILPRVNFYSSMIPLPPPKGYWDKLQSLISKFIWNGKRPRLKFKTLQRDKLQGGLGLPNFKMYFWSFVLRPLYVWLNSSVSVSWKSIEENISQPYRLQDLIFSNIPPKAARTHLGPIISYLLRTCNTVMNHTKVDLKWHNHSPIFNNFSLLVGKKPISFSLWRDKGVHTFNNLFNVDGLRAFSDIRAQYDLPGTSFFFYLQLRSAMKAYGVPWGVPLLTHPLKKLLAPQNHTRGLVSKLYKFISDPCLSLPVESVWDRDLTPVLEEDICWDTVWENLHDTSKNPDHQLIHYKFIHRFYLTPRRRHAMKIIASPNCDLCSLNAVGSFMHMYWECPSVSAFWRLISSTLSDMLEINIPCSPTLLLLNDDSTFDFSLQQKRTLWAGLTAAKKMLALRWQPPHTLPWRQWANSFLDIVMMERSVARMHGASKKTIQAWDAAYSLVKEKVQDNQP